LITVPGQVICPILVIKVFTFFGKPLDLLFYFVGSCNRETTAAGRYLSDKGYNALISDEYLCSLV